MRTYCLSCYRKEQKGYCLPCRKKLFQKARLSPILDFDSPNPENIYFFREHAKRMSVSGVQLKFSLRLEQAKLLLSEQHSRYILKPVPASRYLAHPEDAPENEHLTMQIAEQVFGIPVAANALIYFKDGQPAYITRRFDVHDDGRKNLQEDFAQLTNRTKATHGESYKYDGSYEEIGRLIRQFVGAALPTLENFFRLVLFNYVMSNGDAHLKNFSLFRTKEGEYLLSPAYDLMSTVIHTPYEHDTALSLYEGDLESARYATYGSYGRDNFMELAKRLGILAARAARMLDYFPAQESRIAEMVERSFLSAAVKERYMLNVQDKLRRLR